MLTAWHNEVSLLSSTVQSVAFDTLFHGRFFFPLFSWNWEFFLHRFSLLLCKEVSDSVCLSCDSNMPATTPALLQTSSLAPWCMKLGLNLMEAVREGRNTHIPTHVYREAGIRLSGVCSPWSSSTNYITTLNLTQSVDSVQQRREQAVLRGQCREAVSGWRHSGEGAGVSSFTYTRQLLVNTGYWTRGRLCQFPLNFTRRKALPVPMGLKGWYPWHGHVHVNSTHPLRTSHSPFIAIQVFPVILVAVRNHSGIYFCIFRKFNWLYVWLL